MSSTGSHRTRCQARRRLAPTRTRISASRRYRLVIDANLSDGGNNHVASLKYDNLSITYDERGGIPSVPEVVRLLSPKNHGPAGQGR